MSEIAINSSQNVKIDFTLASIGERMVAHILDWVLKIAYLVIVGLIAFRIFGLGLYLDRLDGWSAAAILIILTFPIHIYTLVSESVMEGQTFGKKIMKIKVVKIDGYQASFGDYLIRWIFRIVDIMGEMAVVGIISMIVSKNNQRLGDIASGTAVISLKNSVTISHTILENLSQDYVPLFPQVVALSDNDMRIIKENFQKAARLDDREIINKLTLKILEILKLDAASVDLTQKQFVQTVIKDYNYYTGKEN